MNSQRVSALSQYRAGRLETPIVDSKKDAKRTHFPSCKLDLSPFERPPVVAPIPYGGSVTFMLLPVTQRKAYNDGDLPIIVLHGITEDRHSVWVNVTGSLPFFYVYFPTRRDFHNIVAIMEAFLGNYYRKTKYREKQVRSQYILDWRVVLTEDIREYKGPGDQKRPHLQIFMQGKSYISDLVKLIRERRLDFYNLEYDSWDILERGEVYESTVRFDIQTLVSKDLFGCYWITARNVRPVIPASGSRAQIQVACDLDNLEPHPTRADIGPIRLMSYDIECETVDGERRFVNAETDPIITIACHVTEYGRPETEDLEIVLSLKPHPGAETEPLGGKIHHLDFDDERDMLCAFKDVMNAVDPDLVSGYNIGRFDNVYCADRAKALHIDHTFTDSSRAVGWLCYPKTKVFKSRGQGTKEGAIVKWVGRIQFDLLEYFQKNVKLNDYTLNAVSDKFLGERKADLPYWKIYPFHHGTPKERRKLYRYCLRDAWLPIGIINKNLYIVSLCEMCRAVGVPFDFLLEKGQQAKTEKKLLQATKVGSYVLPSFVPPKRPYEGAIVVTPHRGFYEIPVVVNDFSSLYPSIMEGYNLCYTTILLVQRALSLGLKRDIDFFVPPLDFAGRDEFCFVRPRIKKGLLPIVLRELLNLRAAAKRKQAECEAAGDKAMAKIYEMRQIALKLTANSIYGFTSADKLPMTEIAETVTAIGRDMIQLTSTLIEERFNRQTPDVPRCLAEGIDPNMYEYSDAVIFYESDAKVIYGDSVTGDTWIPVRNANGADVSCAIQSLCTVWSSALGKEYGTLPEQHYVYSEEGWTPIVHVMRHKTRKEIFRITTRQSSVCVTSDHSLLTRDKAVIKPTDVEVGITHLLSFDQAFDDGLVTSVEFLGVTDDYVYDLETGNHHFAAGDGSLVVHNTDSVFVTFGNVSVERAMDIGRQASVYCKPYYMPPNDSIFEKVIFPCLMVDKKRYAGIWHTWPKPDVIVKKQDAKGIETQRRDWTKLCTKTLEGALKALLVDRDKQGVVKIVHQAIETLYANKTPMCDLVLTKGYTKSKADYDETFAKTGSYPVHIAVARKMEKRDPATAPRNGDRIPYVLVSSVKREFIKGKGWKDVKTSEKAEDPIHVLKNGLVIDADWYVQKQLMGPLMRLLRVALCDEPIQIQDADGHYEKHPEQTDAFKKLFVGPHMNKRVKPIPKDTSGGTNVLFKAFEVVPPCVACGARAPKKGPGKFDACCASCDKESAYAVTRARLGAARHRVECVQNTCVTCQKGTPYDEIVCENKACPNWWERIACAKELTDIEDIISRF